MNKYRSRADIVACILEVAKEPVKKTRIMYRAYLSFGQLQEYLEMLAGRGLLRFDRSGEYIITDKGHEFLGMYDQMTYLLKPINRDQKKD